MPNGLFRASKNSRVMVEDVVLTKSKWNLDFKGDDIDSTNFESGGVDQGLIGIVGIDWDFGGLWDSEIAAFADPPGLYPRDNLGQVVFYENLLDDLFWALPVNRVLSSKNGAEVRQAVTFETSGKLNGFYDGITPVPFVMPGGEDWAILQADGDQFG